MLVTATLLGCVACVKAYQAWKRSGSGSDISPAVVPSVGMHGALVEPRK